MEPYVSRLVDAQIARMLTDHPALLIVGPRAAGKTTTAARYARSIVHLDRPAEAAAFKADPDVALAMTQEPVLLDEWQDVPEVLGAVKRSVDGDSRPGRFILTGSVRADLKSQTWPGTGRLTRIDMHVLNQRELTGRSGASSPIDILAEGDPLALTVPQYPPDLVGYLELALSGGFPDTALRLRAGAREEWLESYLEQILTRDAVDISGRDPVRLARYFEVLALNSAGIPTDITLFGAAGVDRKTADAYMRLLVSLYVAELAPAWMTNRLSRLTTSPKRYITDASLVAAALRLNLGGIMKDGDLIGRLLDTFVASQIRSEVSASRLRPRLFHLRDMNGRHEIDFLIEFGGGKVVALELKATASPSRRDARHLEWLRDRLDDRFLAGVVLHTGPAAFGLSERIAALPIASLWGAARVS